MRASVLTVMGAAGARMVLLARTKARSSAVRLPSRRRRMLRAMVARIAPDDQTADLRPAEQAREGGARGGGGCGHRSIRTPILQAQVWHRQKILVGREQGKVVAQGRHGDQGVHRRKLVTLPP